MVVGGDALAPKDLEQGHTEDFEIEPEAGVIDVPQIEFKFFFPANGIPAVDLGPPGNAGPDVVATHLFGCVEVKVFHQQRPWPDETHIAFESVSEGRQLIKTRLAQAEANTS